MKNASRYLDEVFLGVFRETAAHKNVEYVVHIFLLETKRFDSLRQVRVAGRSFLMNKWDKCSWFGTCR